MTICATQDITAAIVTKLSALLTTWKIYDISNTPDAIDTRAGPVLFPEKRGGFMGNFHIEFVDTGGTEGSRGINLTYTLRYSFAYAIAGSGRGVADSAGVEDALKSLLVAVLQVDALGSTVTGINEFIPSEVLNDNDIILDYAGNPYYGYTVLFQLLELIN
jgi:hypothetical protein